MLGEQLPSKGEGRERKKTFQTSVEIVWCRKQIKVLPVNKRMLKKQAISALITYAKGDNLYSN